MHVDGEATILVAMVQDQYRHKRPILYDVENDNFLLDTGSCARLATLGGNAVAEVYLRTWPEPTHFASGEYGLWGHSQDRRLNFGSVSVLSSSRGTQTA